jgi:imidazoleglycerol phosphate dehydratase HisB
MRRYIMFTVRLGPEMIALGRAMLQFKGNKKGAQRFSSDISQSESALDTSVIPAVSFIYFGSWPHTVQSEMESEYT